MSEEAGHPELGWHEIELQLAALELPPVPPTSDPQRLLSYVLNILPRYAEMEILSTHLRLYTSTLEQDLEQIKGHVRILTREVDGEREKKQFLERYAAQVVKERNELLHAKGSKHQHKKGGSAHFVWHSCCKKNQSHTIDLTPSLAAFRGEKLQERTKEVQSLKDEVHNLEMLRKELDFLLKKSQRESDSKLSANTKQIQQLEKQVIQRSMLHSSLERKLYDVESALARNGIEKETALSEISTNLKDAREQIDQVRVENMNMRQTVASLTEDRQRLQALLDSTTQTKDDFAIQIDQLSLRCNALQSEVEAFRSQVQILQSDDLNDVRSQYTTRIQKLQDDHSAEVRSMSIEIDRLNHELMKKVEMATIQHVPSAPELEEEIATRDHSVDISLPLHSGWDAEVSGDAFSPSSEVMGSSLSRSQLSSSVVSSSVVDAVHSDSGDEDADKCSTIGSRKERDDGETGRSNSLTPFNWESFIVSESDMSSPEAKRTKRAYDDTSPDVDIIAPMENDQFAASTSTRVLTATRRLSRSNTSRGDRLAEQEIEPAAQHSSQLSVPDGSPGSGDFPFEDEEEKDDTIHNGDFATDLVRDLHLMLNGFEEKRKQEEEKAARAEQALRDFQQVQGDFQQLRMSPSS